MTDVVVIGAGLAGLTCAARLLERGRTVTVVSAGIGGIQLGQGTIDVFGYAPERVDDPLRAVAAAPEGHPYATLGVDATRRALEWFRDLLGPARLVGSLDANMLLPTALGVARPTAFAPPSMAAGNVTAGTRYLIVGMRAVKDLHAGLVAENLARASVPGGQVSARAAVIDIAPPGRAVDASTHAFARAMDDPVFRNRVADAVGAEARDGEIVGIPAVLGLEDRDAWADVRDRCGHEVFEIPMAPPSMPGMRLNAALTDHVRAAGGRIVIGGAVVGARTGAGSLHAVVADTAGRTREYAARAFVHCPGGFESGAIAVDSYDVVSETALGLPLSGVPEHDAFVSPDYWSDHALFHAGVDVDDSMRVRDAAGDPVLANLYAAGGILAGASRWREKSGDGIAIASAVRAADAIAEGS